MINLLPLDTKKQLTREYSMRLATLGMMIGSLVLIIGYVLLIPSYVLTNSKEDLIEREQEILRSGDEFTSFDELRGAVADVNGRLEVMQERPSFLASEAILTNLLLNKTADVTFVSLGYTWQVGQDPEFDLRGTARSRGALVDFIQRLEADPGFSVTSAPVSNYVASADLSFLLEIAIVINEEDEEEN